MSTTNCNKQHLGHTIIVGTVYMFVFMYLVLCVHVHMYNVCACVYVYAVLEIKDQKLVDRFSENSLFYK